jgi:hypothetical protein
MKSSQGCARWRCGQVLAFSPRWRCCQPRQVLASLLLYRSHCMHLWTTRSAHPHPFAHARRLPLCLHMTVDFSLIRSLAPCISGITLVGQRSFTSRSLAPRSSIWFEQFAHGLARVIDLLIGYMSWVRSNAEMDSGHGTGCWICHE